jgi:hypothetical protein
MFGLPSFPKLFLLLLVVAVVWYGLRWIGRLDRARREEVGGRRSRGRAPEAVDTVQCKVCDAYVPRLNPRACGRAECPY